MSGLSREMKLRSYAIHLTPDHLYLMGYWAGRISAHFQGRVEAGDLVQECWLHYGRYTDSIKGCSYAIQAFMYHRAKRIRTKGCGFALKMRPIPELNPVRAFNESDEHKYRRNLLEAMLSALDFRTQVVFQLHLNGLTWDAIGCELELTGERTRQLFQKGLRQLLPPE